MDQDQISEALKLACIYMTYRETVAKLVEVRETTTQYLSLDTTMEIEAALKIGCVVARDVRLRANACHAFAIIFRAMGWDGDEEKFSSLSIQPVVENKELPEFSFGD